MGIIEMDRELCERCGLELPMGERISCAACQHDIVVKFAERIDREFMALLTPEN